MKRHHHLVFGKLRMLKLVIVIIMLYHAAKRDEMSDMRLTLVLKKQTS
nr:MAG TPA: hypothetical protein [Caudoviricetes sp.]